MTRATNSVVSLVSAAVVAGCTATNGIDVCDRTAPPSRDVNIRPEGAQYVGGPRALAAMPDGRALLAFGSDATSADRRDEVRVVRVDSDARPVVTCGDEREHTIWPAGDDYEVDRIAFEPPTALSEVGLLAWSTYLESPTSVPSVYVTPLLGSTGCVYEPNPPRRALSAEVPGARIGAGPTIVRLSADRFLVLWTSSVATPLGASGTVHARALEFNGFGEPLGIDLRDPVTDGPVGDRPVDVPAATGNPVLVRAALLGASGIAVLTIAGRTLGGHEPELATFDRALRPIVPPFAIGPQISSYLPGVDADIAFDGRQLLAVWIHVGADARRRLLGRFFTPDGDFLAAPVTPTGEPFAVATEADEQESAPTVVARPEGGFVVAYTRLLLRPDSSEPAQSVALVAFDAEGERQFLDPACDRRELVVSDDRPGDHFGPSIARLADGTIGVVWTARDALGTDADGTAVLGRFFSPRELFPLR